ncbi:voltage-dependent anion-selective channel-like [Prorops nasuta]|uniref:voltage-dependent anion-selective channel-like n=1 Tax=Prorops nasuta TaxID=863751 RepID=UPI0034CFD8A9
MAIPSFGDLGKSAWDVFGNGYHYGRGLFKFNVKTTSNGNLTLATDMALDLQGSKMTGNAMANLTIKDLGILNFKWGTEGVVYVGYDTSKAISMIEGLALNVEAGINPESNGKAGKLVTKFANHTVNAQLGLHRELDSTTNILGSMVIALRDVFVGYRIGYNATLDKITKNDFGLAFDCQDVGVHFRCTSIPDEYGLSLLYRVNSMWETAINGVFAKRGVEQRWTVGVAAKQKLDDDSTLRFKINTEFQLGTSLQQKLLPGILLTLSMNVDCTNVPKGGHKVGLALDMEA